MRYDFDRLVDRHNTHSYKWDQSEKLFGDPDLLPLWVADMDFPSPPAVREAIVRRASQGIYGYTIKSETAVSALTDWFRDRHGWDIRPSTITDCPGIVTALSLAVEQFSEPGAPVLIQTPVYYPFYDVIRMNGRTVSASTLPVRDGRFTMDFEDLERRMRDGAKLMLLCNPHNPGGRVWTREELERLGDLCVQYNVTVVSDEIHCDLALPGHRYTPFASISEALAQRTITCLAPTKTFNLPGLSASFIVMPNAKLKQKFDYRLKTLSLHMTAFFTPDMVEAAYRHGGEWLDQMLDYVQGNVDYAIRYMAEQLPELEPMRPDGTYLLWVDCRALGLDVPGLKELMFKQARVAFSEGSVFGAEGAGFLRMNLACPRSILAEALDRFRDAIRRRQP